MPSLQGPKRQWWLPVGGVAALLASAAVMALLAPGGEADAQQANRALIEEGRRLFLEETFDGNGRTCGTCHPPENNFTLDPAFIARLPGNDPLFVARGKLRPLEENRLIRRFGLFIENLDGFDQPGVLRSVPHTFALRTSLKPPANVSADGFGHATGWSGDGAPRPGTLRDFAVGAVIQHLPKSLERREGIDFRLPTAQELDALEAFQLSLGRQADIDLAALNFSDPFVNQGKALFFDAPARAGGTRSCNGCHENAGANIVDSGGINGNFDTGTAFVREAPACLPSSFAPGDGGLGHEPIFTEDRRDICGAGRPGDIIFRGDGTFNTPPLIEAADTPPFFHNNAVATLEGAVAFYTTDIFDRSPAGQFGGAFVLNRNQINAIAALLRALNVRENINIANTYARDAFAGDLSLERRRESAELAVVETRDALDVLTGGPQGLFLGLGVRELLEEALALQERALDQGLPPDLLEEAIAKRDEAARLMLGS